MAQTAPENNMNRDFQKVFRGYDTAQVDEYIDTVMENYSLLYRENAELGHKLAIALDRLSKLDGEEEKVRKTLETARLASDKIISDAYERSDAILASIKKSCDSILRSFKDKVGSQKEALAKIQESIFSFKNELFEKYRLHIELIEQVTPVFEYEEDLTPEQYVDKVVANMNREITAEFGIKLSEFDEEEKTADGEKTVSDETLVFDAQPKAEEAPVKPEENAPEKEAPKDEAPEKNHPKKKSQKNKKTAVIKLLDEYEAHGVRTPAEPDIQMSFDFDSGSAVLSESK